MGTNKYIPHPRDTQGIKLPDSLKDLSKAMASNKHELEAYTQCMEGWNALEENDEKKKTPVMTSYSELVDSEKKKYLAAVTEDLRFIYLSGYEIKKKVCDSSSGSKTDYNPVKKGWKVVTVVLILLFLLVMALIVWGAINVCTGAFPSTNEVYMSIAYLVIACAFLFGITRIILKLVALYADILHKEHEMLSELYVEEQKKEIIRKDKNLS